MGRCRGTQAPGVMTRSRREGTNSMDAGSTGGSTRGGRGRCWSQDQHGGRSKPQQVSDHRKGPPSRHGDQSQSAFMLTAQDSLKHAPARSTGQERGGGGGWHGSANGKRTRPSGEATRGLCAVREQDTKTESSYIVVTRAALKCRAKMQLLLRKRGA